MNESLNAGRLRRMLAKHPNFVALALGVVALPVLLVVLEATCYVLNRVHPAFKDVDIQRHSSPGPLFNYNSPYGRELAPNNVTHCWTSYEHGPAYQAVYTTNAQGLRTTPVDAPEQRTRFAVFCGCSFTFGEGVNDDETLPYYFGREAPEYYPYNLGVSGNGPQQMLLRLERGELSPLLSQDRGVMVYVFMQQHLARVVGAMRLYNLWARNFPCYELVDGRVTHLGTFEEAHPLRCALYRVLFRSNIVTYFAMDFPPGVSRGQLDLTAAIIQESQRLFLEAYPTSRFVVLFYPGGYERFGYPLKPFLEARGVPYLEYPHLLDGVTWETQLPDHRHPTPRAHEAVARQLVHDLVSGS